MSASRSRQKRKLEPISIEELAGTTGMSGFCSFLTRDTSVQVAVPALDQMESGAPDNGGPDIGVSDSGAALGSAGDRRAPATSTTEEIAPPSAALDPKYGQSPAPVRRESAAPESGAV